MDPNDNQHKEIAQTIGAIALNDDDNQVILAMEEAASRLTPKQDNEKDGEDIFDDCDFCGRNEDEMEEDFEDDYEDEVESEDETSCSSSSTAITMEEVRLPDEIHPDDVKYVRCCWLIKKFSSKSKFQFMWIGALWGFLVYIHKLYEDSLALKNYREYQFWKYFSVSLAALVIPTILNIIYRVCAVILGGEGSEKLKKTGEDGSKEEPPISLTTEIIIEAVNGLLLIPKQIKANLDLLLFSVPRLFEWRKLSKEEKTTIMIMTIDVALLEFFEDFCAGFLQVALQIYIYWETLGWTDKGETPEFMAFELIGSCLSIISMLRSVKRADDGCLTGTLSCFGWISLITARVIVITLATTVVKVFILPLGLLHVITFSIWIYKLALQSHLTPAYEDDPNKFIPDPKWFTIKTRIVCFIMVFCQFGLPSLIYWPMIFQLYRWGRPTIYLIIITIENISLMIIWIAATKLNLTSPTVPPSLLTMTLIVIALQAFGLLCLWYYMMEKPLSCDKVALVEIRDQRDRIGRSVSLEYGIYYNFFDIVFRLGPTDEYKKELDKVGERVTVVDHYENYYKEKKSAKAKYKEKVKRKAEREAIRAKIQAELEED